MTDIDPIGDAPLDPIIHAPARLRIMASLAALNPNETLWFVRLQEMTSLTAGNLTTHLRRLEQAGYVSTSRHGRGPAGRTQVAISDAGRAALRAYKSALQELLGLSEPSASATAVARSESVPSSRRGASGARLGPRTAASPRTAQPNPS